MKKPLKCPSCRFHEGIRAYAELSVSVEVGADGAVIENEGAASVYEIDESRLFCGTCGSDLRLEAYGKGFRLEKVAEEIIERPTYDPNTVEWVYDDGSRYSAMNFSADSRGYLVNR